MKIQIRWRNNAFRQVTDMRIREQKCYKEYNKMIWYRKLAENGKVLILEKKRFKGWDASRNVSEWKQR